MKTIGFARCAVITMTLALTGCGKQEPPAPATPPAATPVAAPAPAEKGTIQTAVEGFTGKTAVDAGVRARDQIKAASETRNRNMEDTGL